MSHPHKTQTQRARLMTRASNGEAIACDEATEWLASFRDWSREIGMEGHDGKP